MQQPFGKGPRLYVGGVADAVSEERIYQHFTKWGSVTDVYFPGKRGQRRVNYCFVTFDDWAAAQQACNQSDRNIDGSVRFFHWSALPGPAGSPQQPRLVVAAP